MIPISYTHFTALRTISKGWASPYVNRNVKIAVGEMVILMIACLLSNDILLVKMIAPYKLMLR